MEWIVITLLLSAFFSGIEIAFISASRLRIEVNRSKGSKSSMTLAYFKERPDRFITTLLVANNIALVVFGYFMEQKLKFADFAFFPDSEPLVLLAQTLCSTVLVLIFGEYIPKVLFRLNPVAVLGFFALPLMYLVYLPLKPISTIFVRMARSLLQVIFNREFEKPKMVFTPIDLKALIDRTTSTNGEDEEDDVDKAILEKALFLRDVKVRECMVHRTEVEGIDLSSSIAELRGKFIETKHSRLIIFEGTIDNVVGYVHHNSILTRPEKLVEVLMEIAVVPETMTARDLLVQMRKEHKSIARVVDEFGGTAGIVTMEDIIEEIFGEINDEHDHEGFQEKVIREGEYYFSGKLEIDYLNEKYDLNLPVGDYETLAGFILHFNENIPDSGEEIEINKFRFKVISSSDRRIDSVRLTVIDHRRREAKAS